MTEELRSTSSAVSAQRYTVLEALKSPALLIDMLKSYFGLRRRAEPVRDAAALQRFLETRASFVAQTSLYGYLRTRAGTRYPELFDDDAFVVSINIAKWQIWLDCLGDLACFAGGALVRAGHDPAQVGALVRRLVGDILTATGVPHDCGEEFGAHAQRVRERLEACDWAAMTDDEGPFAESPGSLVHWAPVVQEFKVLDAEIVQNSVRFRWQEIRRDLRANLDPAGVMAGAVEV
ncbi:MAG: hypothetical protein LPJ91_01285 [Pseudazoarcus pumilus]|nr:hypothetical protein [Pseudazoarcus pumilus]